MKRFRVILLLSALVLCTLTTQANNDFLEQINNYSVMPMGNGVVRFKIPVWSYGWQNNYRLGIGSHVWYSMNQSGSNASQIFYFRSTDKQNCSDPKVNSSADVDLRSGMGTVKITRTTSGTMQIDAGSGNHSVTLPAQKSLDGSFDRVVYLEFDWYLPESLTSRQFYVGMSVNIFKYKADDTNSDNIYKGIWYIFPDRLDGSDQLMAPELQSPYLYLMDESGSPMTDGKAAIPYVVYQTPKSYTTTLNSTPVNVSNRAGAIIVQAADSVQRGFKATFTVQPNADVTTTTTRSTNRIDIPAFHRIYDFSATEQKDEMESYNGRNQLTWTIRNPQATDLMTTDYFEIQRAMKADYSDAMSIGLEPMEAGKGTYTFTDDTRNTDSGIPLDTATVCREMVWDDYLLTAEDGDPLYDMSLKLIAKSQVLPAAPVYYRVRRASTGAWEWDHPFAKATTLYRHNFLAPLAATQADYTKDPEFDTNHRVHFNVKIDNALIMDQGIVTLQDCELVPYFTQSRSARDSIRLIVELDPRVFYATKRVMFRSMETGFEIELRRGKNVFTFPVPGPCTYDILVEISDNTATFNGYDHNFVLASYTLDQEQDSQLDGMRLDIQMREQTRINGLWAYWANVTRYPSGEADSYSLDVARARWEQVKDTVLRQMHDSLLRTLNPTAAYGRCMWDRGAQLILMRTLQETGTTMEFVVPQDSIRRNDDGSWSAHITDVANMACTNYSYKVRIDPSASSIRFQNPVSLQPVAINGPSLYFNEAANILSFTASKGDAARDRKSGVLLQWIPTSAAVDQYILMRLPVGSTNSPDTIYRGMDNSYFDTSAVPGQHYEYTITTHYNCNSVHTNHSATAEGWRTPYGEISGYIHQTDNSGMAGVTVSLSADGQPLKTLVTGADGAFLFDSIAYGNGTNYTVMPTSQYGTFSYNNSSSGVATVSLAADGCVQQGVEFVNTSCVRLTGRVLYDMSTIPVSGVCFILNGDTIRRGNNIYTSGTDGNFELTLPKSMPCRLQAAKAGHTFRNDGWLFVTGTDTTFSLVKALDGIRFYDQTKVRLVGRVAGGTDQQKLPPALGFGTNNLGDDLQLVLMLEGDNTAHIVHNPDDLTQDTLHFAVDSTQTIYEQKRIIVRPDVRTGEYAVDLFPVKYKVVQATATGYATLLDVQAGAPTFDLTGAPLTMLHSDSLDRHATFNARYDCIYRNPIQIGVQQMMYGMVQDGLGEEKLVVSSIVNQSSTVALYSKDSIGTVNYLFGHPIFQKDRTYQYRVGVYEDYYYNNDKLNARNRVRLGGGELKVYNGFKAGGSLAIAAYPLDEKGEAIISMEVDDLNLLTGGESALRTLDLTIEREGSTINYCAIRGFITGNVVENGDIRSMGTDVQMLDILRDPPGSGSSCYLEKGASYKSTASFNLTVKFGLNGEATIGTAFDQSVGVIAAGASYTGVITSVGKAYKFNLPIVTTGKYSRTNTCTYTTTEKISTNSSPSFVGAMGDVFIGHENEVLFGTVRAVRVIDDSTFVLREPAVLAGYIQEIASAVGADGKTYHFVIAKETVVGGKMGAQFAYTQNHIVNTLIPKLIRERNALLIDAPDQAAAQSIANAQKKAVYWNMTDNSSEYGLPGKYKFIKPQTVADFNEPDKISALNAILTKWTTILIGNEKEKIEAIQSGNKVGTYSVSGGASRDYSESFSGEFSQAGNLSFGEDITNVYKFFKNDGNALANNPGKINVNGQDQTVNQYYQTLQELINKRNEDAADNANNPGNLGVDGKAAGTQWKTEWKWVFDVNIDGSLPIENESGSRKIGFTINPDSYAYTTVSVYRSKEDSLFKKQMDKLTNVVTRPAQKQRYGSFVFFQEGGSSHCPYEGETRTNWYYPGQFVLGNATLPIENPKITLDQYTISNVPADQDAVFRLTLMNDNLNTDGRPARGQYLSLSVDAQTNPNGAIILIDGEPLTSASTLTFYCEPGDPIIKTLQVRRGIVDDYEDITLRFASTTCQAISVTTKLSVHFIPESSPVNLAFPRDKWVMNTLSARDSIGYYLPVTIDGFNIRHRNFDHIEFQYKLSTENNDAWVNQCSFYADDSLYNAATGNKAMIENGRIEPFRFYGERDPKELSYDLRAVSYCRYGSGFVSKASPVVTGIKDTRPPVLFGKAQPANGILTLKDDIALRFSEPIAGNWLDEDNNFQILGVTNNTGITQTTSLYFDGNAGHYAYTKIDRELAITDLTIDMLIKPAEQNREMALLTHGDDQYNFTFSLTADNRLKMTMVEDGAVTETKLSKPMSELSTVDFTRVIMVYDFDEQTVRFYAGTKDITDQASTMWMLQNNAAPFLVGADIDSTNLYHGNIMETRIWTKPLTPAEISNTHLRRLTGYEYGLLDYYPMNESKGEELSDLATGATLTAKGLTWTRPQGISLATNGAAVQLQPTLFSRTEAEDYTLLFWFRSNNAKADTVSLFGTAVNDSTTLEIALHNGDIQFLAGEVDNTASANLTDGNWHHCALVIDKTFNNGSLAIDGQKVLTFPALQTGALSGTKVWMAKGLKGNIDEVCLFEQPLPSELLQEFGKQSPNGEEMGLLNLLTFSQIKRNSSNVMELVFSPDNRRVFKDANGNVVQKVQPLLVGDLSAQADKSNAAPICDRGQLTRLPFTWTYRLSDMMINIKAQPREINKRTMYLTVRDVEDLNGNRLAAPVTWTVYADLNSVRWNERTHRETLTDDEQTHRFTVHINNTTGITRQFTINNLPNWLSASPEQGTLEAEEDKTITFTINAARLKIGTHHHLIYLTDDQGLAEPLLVEVSKETEPPYANVDLNRYPLNMSLCGRVLMSDGNKTVINTNEQDYVYAIYNNECVGVAHCNNNGELYLTVHGDESMNRKQIRFQLWKAANGKTYMLTPNTSIQFAHGRVYGCGENEPVQLTTGGGEMQTIPLSKGWNWISTNLSVQTNLQRAITAEQAWSEGDMIKNPASRQFCTYSEQQDNFRGTLSNLSYTQMYMMYVSQDNSLHIFGDKLHADSMRLTLRGGGQWNALPCMLSEVTPLREALNDYYDHATPGDLVKGHNSFAVFSQDKQWVGDLTALRPGNGYLLRRMGQGAVTVKFINSQANSASSPTAKRSNSDEAAQRSRVASSLSGAADVRSQFSNPQAATNMTMIAKVDNLLSLSASGLLSLSVAVYVGDELAAVAEPLMVNDEPYYFLTIQSDRVGDLRFEMNGQPLMPVDISTNRYFDISNVADSHHGSLRAPVLLTPVDADRPYKIIEDDRVVIIRNGERYDVTGKKL